MSALEVDAVLCASGEVAAFPTLKTGYHPLPGDFLHVVLATVETVVGEDCWLGVGSFVFGEGAGRPVDHDVRHFVAQNINILIYSVKVALEEKFLGHVDFDFDVEVVEGLWLDVENSEEVGAGVFLEILDCEGEHGIGFNSFAFVGDVLAFDGKAEGYFEFGREIVFQLQFFWSFGKFAVYLSYFEIFLDELVLLLAIFCLFQSLSQFIDEG